MTKETSQKIKNMGFICALFVVSIHIDWHADESQLLWWGRQLIKSGIAGIAVPFFFVVSGYFLAAHFDEDGWWKRENQKRIRTLIVPFMFWSLIYYAFISAVTICRNLYAHNPIDTDLYFNMTHILGFDMNRTPLLPPLWYVRNLVLLVLTGGIFKFAVRRLRTLWIVLAFILYQVCSPSALSVITGLDATPIGGFILHGYSRLGFLYFSIGVYIRQLPHWKLSNKTALICFVVGLSLLATEITLQKMGMSWSRVLSSTYMPLILLSFYHFIPSTKWPRILTACSFPIFVMHMIPLRLSIILSNHFLLPAPEIDTLLQWSVSVAVPIAVAVLLRRFFPKTASVLFGGR